MEIFDSIKVIGESGDLTLCLIQKFANLDEDCEMQCCTKCSEKCKVVEKLATEQVQVITVYLNNFQPPIDGTAPLWLEVLCGLSGSCSSYCGGELGQFSFQLSISQSTTNSLPKQGKTKTRAETNIFLRTLMGWSYSEVYLNFSVVLAVIGKCNGATS